MSFTANIPVSGQTLGASRSQIVLNFSTLRTTISNATQPNHIDVNNPTGQGAGKHIFVQMPIQTPGAANQPGANEGGIIAQTDANGSTELYYAHDNQQSAGIPIYRQFTGASINGNGYAYVAGGILIQWAQATASDNTIINFPRAFSAAAFSVVANENFNAVTPADILKPALYTATGFTIRMTTFNGASQGAAQAFAYIAIGPA